MLETNEDVIRLVSRAVREQGFPAEGSRMNFVENAVSDVKGFVISRNESSVVPSPIWHLELTLAGHEAPYPLTIRTADHDNIDDLRNWVRAEIQRQVDERAAA